MIRFPLMFRTVILLGLTLTSGNAALITFTTRTAFSTAAPGLPVETFESGLVAPDNVTVCPSPVSSLAGNGCFPTSGLLPGVIYSAAGGSSPGMAVIGAGFEGLSSSKIFGPNAFFDSLNITFAGANAAGFQVYAGTTTGPVTIDVFGTANSLLGTFIVTPPTINGTFFGVISDTGPITRINVANPDLTTGELIDDLAFGTVVVPEPASLLLSGSAMAVIWMARRHNKRTRY